MKLVLLGPPASGKGTQAIALEERLGIPKISTGDMLRAARRAGTELGKQADAFMSAGKLVPDEVVIGLVAKRLEEPDAKLGFVLDGFPRTLPQAERLSALLSSRQSPLQSAIYFDVPRDLLVERATLRRTDLETGQIYHLKYNPPPPGAQLEHRADDREETVIKRLDEYDAMTAVLLPYYEHQGLLVRIDGTKHPREITSELLKTLGAFHP